MNETQGTFVPAGARNRLTDGDTVTSGVPASSKLLEDTWPAVEPPPSALTGPAGADLIGEFMRAVLRWLQAAREGSKSNPDNYRALEAWLAPGQDSTRWSHEIGPELVTALIGTVNPLRTAAWRLFVAEERRYWLHFVEDDLGWKIYQINGNLRGDKLFRRELPFDAGQLVQLLTGDAIRKSSDLERELLRTAIMLAVERVCQASPQRDEPLSRAQKAAKEINSRRVDEYAKFRKNGEQAVLQRPSENLWFCLERLLGLDEDLWALGCLTKTYCYRLFSYYPRMLGPYLGKEEVEQASNASKGLRSRLGRGRSDPNPFTLRAVCEALAKIDPFTQQLRSLLNRDAAGAYRLKGEYRGEYRRWVPFALASLKQLGDLARWVLDQPGASPAAAQDSAAARSAPTVYLETPMPPAEEAAPVQTAPPQPETIVKERRLAQPSVAAPVQATVLVRLDADGYFSCLGRRFPPLQLLETAVVQAVQLRENCRKDWQDALEALEGLIGEVAQWKERLSQPPPGMAAADWETLVRQGGPTAWTGSAEGWVKKQMSEFADILIRHVVRLDQRLPGEGEDGPLEPLGPRHLAAPMQHIRDKVFAFMADQGGYNRYALAIGDSVEKHSGRLRVLGGLIVCRRVKSTDIAQIVTPGYIRRCDGREENVRPPEVRLAK